MLFLCFQVCRSSSVPFSGRASSFPSSRTMRASCSVRRCLSSSEPPRHLVSATSRHRPPSCISMTTPPSRTFTITVCILPRPCRLPLPRPVNRRSSSRAIVTLVSLVDGVCVCGTMFDCVARVHLLDVVVYVHVCLLVYVPYSCCINCFDDFELADSIASFCAQPPLHPRSPPLTNSPACRASTSSRGSCAYQRSQPTCPLTRRSRVGSSTRAGC